MAQRCGRAQRVREGRGGGGQPFAALALGMPCVLHCHALGHAMTQSNYLQLHESSLSLSSPPLSSLSLSLSPSLYHLPPLSLSRSLPEDVQYVTRLVVPMCGFVPVVFSPTPGHCTCIHWNHTVDAELSWVLQARKATPVFTGMRCISAHRGLSPVCAGFALASPVCVHFWVVLLLLVFIAGQ